MESAYIYVRVSTDEQKRKGYSLVEQEERLLNHCEINNIKVKGIFREDFSAKDFNRPEWKRLIKVIKRNKHRLPENVLFLKWDRFSRNIEFAYQMIGVLKELNVRAVAIDQPIDFEVPESIVMLAVYLSIPEAENNRRGRNASDGMRRAKKMGRWPGRCRQLNDRLVHVNKKLIALSCNDGNWLKEESGILQSYRNQDIAGKRHIISLFSPTSIDPLNKTLGPLRLDDALAKIIRISEN
jgi:DNA invertase Pin-like site-specific DNA recombinase